MELVIVIIMSSGLHPLISYRSHLIILKCFLEYFFQFITSLLTTNPLFTNVFTILNQFEFIMLIQIMIQCLHFDHFVHHLTV